MEDSIEEVKVSADQTMQIEEAKAFISNLNQDSQNFLRAFMGDLRVCFRCILMLFNDASLPLYRIQDYAPLYASLDLPPLVTLCSICQGVNQYCHLNLGPLCEKVRA